MIMDCIFCKIISKEIPAKIIHETNNSICFRDSFPRTQGNVLVIPKKHCEKINERTAEENTDLMSIVKYMSVAYTHHREHETDY